LSYKIQYSTKVIVKTPRIRCLVSKTVAPYHCSATDLHHELHWLPATQCVNLKAGLCIIS